MGQISNSGVYSPITMKFGMKVDLWTLITGKLLWSGYLGNGCHGDQKYFSELYSNLLWYWNLSGALMGMEWLGNEFPGKLARYYGNQKHV